MRGPIMALGVVVAVAVLLLLGILLSVEFGLAGKEEYVPGAPVIFESVSGEMTLTATLKPAIPAVGRLAVLAGSVTDADGNLVEQVQFEVTVLHLEDGKNMTKFLFLAPDGTFLWKFQFFDGAAHQLSVAATSADGVRWAGSMLAESEIDVVGFDPPLVTKVKTIGYLLMVVFIGLVVGIMICGGFSVRRPKLPGRGQGEWAA